MARLPGLEFVLESESEVGCTCTYTGLKRSFGLICTSSETASSMPIPETFTRKLPHPMMRKCVCPESLVKASIVDTPEASSRRSEEHTSELQSLRHLVCRLL